ncbi:hypothetical protein T492DRAFT_1026058 [Pavlovales sp. CCMP2436]|nr:hypothetical protein T492DRAFT_1026058 [Pavlovales sp. CCMP2436]
MPVGGSSSAAAADTHAPIFLCDRPTERSKLLTTRLPGVDDCRFFVLRLADGEWRDPREAAPGAGRMLVVVQLEGWFLDALPSRRNACSQAGFLGVGGLPGNRCSRVTAARLRRWPRQPWRPLGTRRPSRRCSSHTSTRATRTRSRSSTTTRSRPRTMAHSGGRCTRQLCPPEPRQRRRFTAPPRSYDSPQRCSPLATDRQSGARLSDLHTCATSVVSEIKKSLLLVFRTKFWRVPSGKSP